MSAAIAGWRTKSYGELSALVGESRHVDRGWRAFAPLTDAFILSKSGEFVGG